MGKIIAYVRFPDGQIVLGCYDRTADYMYPWLITNEDLQANYDGNIFIFNEDMFEDYDMMFKDRDSITDAVEAELWIYGSYYMYDCKASKSEMYITSAWEEDDQGKEIGEWVKKLLDDDYSDL